MNITGFTPHKGQLNVINGFVKTNHKFGVVVSSRQWGKSLLGINSLFYWLLNNPKTKGAWISPIYKQCEKVFDEITNVATSAIKSSNKAKLTIEFINGSTLQFLSAERGDSIRGFSFHYMVVDESAFLKQDVFEQAILPTLSALGRKCLLISTPKGKNWFYTWFLRGSDGGGDFVSFRGYTQDNPYIDKDFIEECRTSMPPSVFAQEFEAEFTDDGNDVFTNLEEVCILNEWTEPTSGNNYFAGIDTGLSNDASVCVIINDRGRICRIHRIDGGLLDDISREFGQLIRRYGCRTAYVENNGVGAGMVELMKKQFPKITPFNTTNESKQNGIQQLIQGIQDLTFEFPSRELMPEFYNEFQAFTYKQLTSGRLQFNAPSGYHDDIVMATMMANEARTKSIVRNKIYVGKYT